MKAFHFVPLLALLCVGFVHPPAAQQAAPSAPASLVAPKDKALVVFVRPSRLGRAVNFYVFDQSKQLLTLFKGREHVAIAVEPGKHSFYVVSENAALVRAELAAGRTYIIHTQARMGAGKARVTVEPVLRSSPSFTESVEWIRGTSRGEPDFDKGKKWVKKRRDALDTRISEAEAEWAEMDEKRQAGITLRAEDGRTAEEASKL